MKADIVSSKPIGACKVKFQGGQGLSARLPYAAGQGKNTKTKSRWHVLFIRLVACEQEIAIPTSDLASSREVRGMLAEEMFSN